MLRTSGERSETHQGGGGHWLLPSQSHDDTTRPFLMLWDTPSLSNQALPITSCPETGVLRRTATQAAMATWSVFAVIIPSVLGGGATQGQKPRGRPGPDLDDYPPLM